jgi:hypothetical protein
MKCEKCVYSELVAQQGLSYTFLDPFGDEVSRVHQQTVLMCRAMPPIAGTWPQVSVDDWCGHFKEGPTFS